MTILESTGDILAIRRNYDQNDMLMRRQQYFVHYKFLPGLGFYGFGLTHMIGGCLKPLRACYGSLLMLVRYLTSLLALRPVERVLETKTSHFSPVSSVISTPQAWISVNLL